jgi:hypothetical protein
MVADTADGGEALPHLPPTSRFTFITDRLFVGYIHQCLLTGA